MCRKYILCRITGKTVLGVLFQTFKPSHTDLHWSGGRCQSSCTCHQYAIQQSTTKAALLVDASNAFYSLNRQVALHKFLRRCSALAIVTINTYRGKISIFLLMESAYRPKRVTLRKILLEWPYMLLRSYL